MKLFTIAALVCLVVSTPLLASTPEECDQFVRDLPKEYEAGEIEVPEDYGSPDGRKIKVFYYHNFNSADAKHKPLVFFNGGPFMAIHGIHSILKLYYPKFILIDQRGTGCSSLLPTGISKGEVQRAVQYNTKNTALDAEEIRKKILGDRKWIVAGQSWGGFIAFRYLMEAPQGVESLHIHGASVASSPLKILKDRLKGQVRVSEAFFKKYSHLKKNMAQARKDLEGKCFPSKIEGYEACGPGLVDYLFMKLGFRFSWGSLALEIFRFYNVFGGGPLNPKVGESAKALAPEPLEPIYPALLSVEFGMDTTLEESCKTAVAELEREGVKFHPWTINECGFMTSVEHDLKYEGYEWVRDWIDPMTVEGISDAVSRNPDVPFYWYSGEHDSFAAVEGYQDLLARIRDKVHYHHFEKSGHEGFMTESLFWKNIKK